MPHGGVSRDVGKRSRPSTEVIRARATKRIAPSVIVSPALFCYVWVTGRKAIRRADRTVGGVSLNDNSAAALMLRNFISIAAQRNLAIMIAHHAAKGLMFPLPPPGSTPKRDPVAWGRVNAGGVARRA